MTSYSIEHAASAAMKGEIAIGSLNHTVINTIPSTSVTWLLKRILKPEYQNSVFTWQQIEQALNSDFRLLRPNNEYKPI